MRHRPFVRATALVMSWVLAATTAWAGAPVVVTPPVNVPLPALYPQLPAVARPEAATLGTVPEAFAPAVAAFAPEAGAFAPEPMTEASPPPAPVGNVGIFGPQRYVRTTGPKNVYTTTVAVPAWVASPFTMHIQNGEPNGTYRVSSAWIEVNAAQVAAAPANFNQNVPALDRSVALTPQSALKVTLASKPTSYLTISLLGTSADHTAPKVTIEAPVAQEVIKDTRPRLVVKYRDVVGSSEPAASGVDTTSLKVTLDGVDRTSLFTRRSDEATADIPEALALAEGPHILAATIKDLAGNPGQASAGFRVDLTKPTIEEVEPAEGSYLPTLRPTIRVRYADDVGIDLARLSIAIDGSDRTHDFLVGPAEATATLDLAAGPRQVTAAIKDKAGNAADTSRGFRLDVEPPTLTIDQPLAGSRLGLPDVEVLIHYRDDQGLELATFKASVDGTPIVLATGPEGASGTVHLGDAPQHILAAEIKDKAGNLRNASSEFSVDTGAPFVRVVQPPPGQIIATATPHVFIEYSDAQGVDTTTFKLWVGPSGARVDRTSWCVAAAAGADCTIPPADRLPEGDNVITGEIKDSTGNPGTADSRFKVDTVRPTGSLVAPANPTNVAKPTITFTYDDGAGTGIDAGSVHVFVDGADRTDRFLPGAIGVMGSLPEALAEGEHPVRLEMADLAGNAAVVLGAFTVDTLPPSGSFTKPAADTFINDPTPELALAYGDGTGTGVVAPQVKVFLQRGSDEWADVTSYFQRGADRAIGVVPDAAPLADGTYHLRAEIQDPAGNAATIHASFQLDTVAPTYTIQTPANGAHLPTRTPSFLVTYGDNASGVDKAKVALLVDGADVTSQLPAATATELGGTLAQSLAEGDHVVAVKVLDRAGNQAVIAPQAFTVDTVPPVVVIELPHDGDFLGDGQQLIRITYSDPNGDAPDGTIDPASVKVTVDGIDRTADFTPADSRAEATLTLAHGPHTVNAELVDWAANPGAASTTFFIDTQPPVVHIQSPIEGSFLPQAPVSVTGTLTDDDSTTTVECQGAGDPLAAIVNAGTFTCTVPLAERGNVVRATAKDRFGRTGSDSRNVTLDTLVPVIAILHPQTGDATAGASIDVLGQVHDESVVTVVVGTTPADVQGDSFRATVRLGAGPVEHIVATATDAAGHTSEAFVDVTIDRLAPVAHITSPLSEAYLKGPTIDVRGTVSDASSVSVEVNQQPAAVSGPSTDATFWAVVPVVDGRIRIEATAHDAAANTGGDGVWVNVDSVAPAIVITEPAPGFVTRGASVHVAGTATDASSFTLKIEGQVVPVVSGTFAADVPLPAEGSRDINAYAIDAAGNEATAGVPIVVDRTPPALEVVSPVEGAVLGALPISVVGTVSDATSPTVTVDTQSATRTEQAWQAAVGGLPEGGHTFTVIATDGAGNATTVHRAVTIDLSPPVVHIITPADGAVTRDGSVTVSGEVEDRSAVTVVVGTGGPGQPAVVTGTGPFHFTGTVALADGDNTITATATDQTAQPGSAFVRVTRDSIAPIIELVTPEKISRGRPGQATVVVTDNLGLGVTFTVKVDGSSLGSFTSSPAVVPLSVPAGKVAGDSFQVSVEATDAAGNPAAAQRDVTVISDGVIVGQVLVDTTSLPLPGATVRMTTTSGVETATTDERGRYSFPTGDVAAVLSVEKTGMTGVERELTIESGTGTVPVDARLTSLADAKTILPDGGSVTAGRVTLTVGAGAGGAYRLTPLSAQGLPGLLPMGWSPLAAFHLSAPADGGALSASATGLPALATYLVEYRPVIHEWSLVASTGTPVDGALTFAVPGPGSFAVVAADGDTVPIPAAAGDVLIGVPFQMLPPTATSTSVVTPATLPPSGGIARGALQVISPTALPSGTVLQAQVTETFTLSSGEVASEEQRRQDIVLFAHPRPAEATLAAEIPITPSRTFATTELAAGKVHLDILAGREGVRGKTGGLEAAQVDSGDVRLGLARQSLAADTAVAVEQTVLSPFLPSSASLVPLGEAVVDFAGQRLAFAAELSLADPGVVAPGDTLLVARVERVDGIPRLVVVALAELSGGRVRTIATPPLPGLREEGRYVFYRSALPIGFVSGMVTPVAGRALVEMTGAGAMPFVALTSADGHYLLAVAAGAVTVRARLLKTALAGEASVTVEAGQTAALDIALVGSVTTATVSPARGAVVAPNSQLTLSTDTALDPSKVTAGNIHLKKTGSSVGVDLRFVLSGSGKTLTIVPTPPEDAPENAVALEFSTDYTFEASGLKTVLGGDVLVPTVNFRTKDDTPPVYDSNALTFSFPDADGQITITAPAGSFPPGTQILIINAGNGAVGTFTAENDGAVGVVLPATMPATINDFLSVTITDPQGNTTHFNRSQFVDPATGKVAIGPGGGIVEASDGSGMELRIPEGALDKGVTLQISAVGEESLPALFPKGQLGTLLGDVAHFGSALKIEAGAATSFKKEIDLAFPLPDFTKVPEGSRPPKPEDAFYYVYRRVERPGGIVVFEVVDHAFIQEKDGVKKVVTASPPFLGLAVVLLAETLILAWSFEAALTALSSQGGVTGRVLRPQWNPNDPTSQDPAGLTYLPVEGAEVTAIDASGTPLSTKDGGTFARSAPDGNYMLVDRRYTGGPVRVQATLGNEQAQATALEVVPADTGWANLRFYQKLAKVNLTFPMVPPPAAPSQIRVTVLRADTGQDTNGLVVANTDLIIGFRAQDGDVRGAELDGQSLTLAISTDSRFQMVVNGGYRPQQAGTHVVTATALGAFGGPASSSYTFRVVAEGGGVDNLPDSAPAVIEARTQPQADATGVAVTAFPQVAFTEPVNNVPGNVRLLDAAGNEVAIKLSGVGPGPNVVDDISTADVVVTSLTIQPLGGLRYNTRYRLLLGDGIRDLDKDGQGSPAPKSLMAYETSFTTFGPQALMDPGTGETFTSPGMVLLGERAYVVQNNFFNGVLRAFNVSDPVNPLEIPSAQAVVTWRPVDLTGIEETALTEGRLVAVATSSTNQSKPSNVYLFDTSNDAATRWIGAVSLTTSAIEGFINRIAIKDGFVYAATAKKGIQVVDLAQAKALFEPPGSANYFRMVQSFNTDGQGFGQEAVVQAIPVKDASGRNQMLWDLKVGDFVVDSSPEPLVVATGEAPLVIVNPQTGATVSKPAINAQGGSLAWGQALALGTVESLPIAVVVGNGTTPVGSAAVLAVVALTDPRAPETVSVIRLDGVTGTLTDVLLQGTTAYVGTSKEVLLVSIGDPSRPVIAGTLTGVAGRLALGANSILFGTVRSVFGGNDPLGGVRAATLDILPLIAPPAVFAVDRKNKSLEPSELKLQVVPASTKVETAELEVYQEGNLARTIPLPAFFGGSTTYTFLKGSDFNADSRYQARLVINKGLGQKEKVSGKQSLRPARFDILGTEEVTLVQGKDPVDVVRMYNSAPDVTLTFKSFIGVAGLPLGAGDNVTVNVEGTVKSSVAPIERVVVNENVVSVTPTGSGTEGRGPFTGSYTATVEVGPQAELVTAYAVDGLNHVSTQSLAIDPRERILGVIPGRDVVPLEPLVPGPREATPYQFRVELKDKGSPDSSAKIEVVTGVETKTLTLKREGDVFRSEPLLALPESLKLPASATDPVKNTRLMVRLGAKPQLKYGTVEAKAIVSGVALVPAGPARIADFVDPASGQGYVIEVGIAGTSGNLLSATVTSLGGGMEALDAGLDPTRQGFAVAQVSADPESPSFNLYRATGSDALLAVMDGIQTSGSGKRQRVVPFGRLKVTVLGQDLMLPVGAGADRVRWETLEVRPLYAEGLLESLFSFLTGPALPKWWQVTQAATFMRGDTPVPGLRVSGFLDRRTRLVDEDSGITAVVPQGNAWAPVTFPQLSDADGRIRFRVKATAVDEGSTQPLAGVVLALTDVVGIRAIGLLGTGTGGTLSLPAVVDVSSEHGKEYKATPIVAGFVSAGGLPRRHNEWYKRLSRLVVEQVVGNDPGLLGIKDHLEAGLRARGIAYTAEQLEEYYVFFMLGAMVGFPRGAVGAFKDSVVGVYDLVGSVGPLLKFLAPKTGTEAVLQLTFAPLPGGVLIAKGVLGAQYVLENREKLQKLLPLLEKAAEFLGREEIQAQLTASLANSVLGNYQQELGKLVGYFGMTEGSLGYRPLVLGYSVGAIGGYFTEFGVELVGATLVGEGVGAALPVMLKAGRIPAVGGRVAAAMKTASRLALAGGDGSKLARGFSFLVKFLDALGPNVLERWMLRIAEVEGGPERMFALLIKYGETADGEVRLLGIARGLTGDAAAGTRSVENVVETLITMQKMAADAEYRGTSRLVVAAAENAEAYAQGVGRAMDLSKSEATLADGFDLIFREIDDAEAFFAALAREDGQTMDDALRAVAATAACTVPVP